MLLTNSDRIQMAELISNLALSRFEPPSPLLRVLAYHLLPFVPAPRSDLLKKGSALIVMEKRGFQGSCQEIKRLGTRSK